MTASIIRQASENDLPAVLDLYAQPIFNGSACSLVEANEILRTMSVYPFYRLFVAEADGLIVGTFTLLVMDNISKCGLRSAIIESVVVRESHQAQGIGTAMMRHACKLAFEKGAYKICLFTGSPNDYVHQFYSNLGFRKHGLSYVLEAAEQGEAA